MNTEIHSSQCERIVLNALLTLPNKYWANHIAELNTSLFVDARHQQIFDAWTRVSADAKRIEVAAVVQECQKQSKIVVPAEYITTITAEKLAVTNIDYHVTELQNLRIRRDLESICVDGLAAARDVKNTKTGATVVNQINAQISGIQLSTVSEAAADSHAGLQQLLARIEERAENEDSITKSGIIELDNKVNIEAGHLVIVGARPAMGKTTLMQTYAMHIALRQNRPVLIMSAEMSIPDLYARMISSLATVPISIVNDYKNANEISSVKITNAFALLDKKPIYIEPKSSPTLSDVRHAAFATKARHGEVGAIFIDYLQLMGSLNAGRNDTEANKIAEISKGLKAIAKEFNCPVIALAQLNRELEKRPNKRPIMSDIRASGQIEQDADLIMFLYRDEVYNKDSEHRGTAEIIIGKNRHGPVGEVRVVAALQYSQFLNISGPQMQGYDQ